MYPFFELNNNTILFIVVRLYKSVTFQNRDVYKATEKNNKKLHYRL